MKDALNRIAQEAIHNMAKHAGAGSVAVRLDQADGVLRLHVTDDGEGFDPAAVPARHMGPEVEIVARTHVSNILGKLGLASRTQAALWAVDHKLAGPRGWSPRGP